MSDRELNGLEVAIVGLSCRFPGANSPEEFWNNLIAGKDTVSDFSEEELLLVGCDFEIVLKDGYVKSAGVLDKPFVFDAGFFNITPKEALCIDPQQRIFMECAWEAFENAGYIADETGAVGVFAGCSENSYYHCHIEPNNDQSSFWGETYSAMHRLNTHMPLRVSYKFDLQGPSIFLNSTCSTSLVAVNMACKALLAGECDMALAGASAVTFPCPEGYITDAPKGALSPDGRCHSFCKSAQGMVPGSGVGVVLLKRLEDAISDNDNIRAVIKGTAVNNDGRQKIGYTAPSIHGQAEVSRIALEVAELDPQDINFVEAHGTATPLGDPIEVHALNEAFGLDASNTIAIGSVKSNIGHAGEAAGIAGLIKSVLALEHRQLPPTLNFSEANPELEIDKTPFYVAEKAVDWKEKDLILRAAVNSVGLGGTNAHVVLEEAPTSSEVSSGDGYHLLTMSARTDDQLRKVLDRLTTHLKENPSENIANVAYTTHVGRKAFLHRVTVVARNASEAVSKMTTSMRERYTSRNTIASRKILISGGHDNIDVASSLYNECDIFRSEVNKCLSTAPDTTKTLVLSELGINGSPVESGSSVTTFISKLSLANVWKKWGLNMQEALGFGLGELVADAVNGRRSVGATIDLLGGRDELKSATQAELSDLGINLKKDQVLFVGLCNDAENYSAMSGHCVPSLYDDKSINAPARLLMSLGKLWEDGWEVDWTSFHGDDTPKRVPLPSYPFEETVHRPDPVVSGFQDMGVEDIDPVDEDSDVSELEPSGDFDEVFSIRQSIAKIWAELLGHESYEDTDSFIEMGGDSLLGAKLVNRLNQLFPVEIPMASIFRAPVLKDQVQVVEELLIEKVELMSGQDIDDLLAVD